MKIKIQDSGDCIDFMGIDDKSLVTVNLSDRVIIRRRAVNLLQERDKRSLATKVNATLKEHNLIY